MMTFLTKMSHHRTMRDLDDERLCKQFDSALKMLKLNLGYETGPRNFAARSWEGYDHALIVYAHACIQERVRRWGTRTDVTDPNSVDPTKRLAEVQYRSFPLPAYTLPPWWGDLDIYRSHRSALVREDSDHYGVLWNDVPEDWPMLWPVIDKGAPDGYRLHITGMSARRVAAGELTLPDREIVGVL